MKKGLQFSVNQIIIDGNPSQIKDFEVLKDDLEITKIGEKEEILYVKKIIYKKISNRFVEIYFQEGEKYPYPDEIFDTRKVKIGENPRPVEDIELSKQLFILIDLKTSRIFLSDQRKKEEVLDWLRRKINKHIIIKPLMGEKEFLDKIKKIKEISFSVESNLFSSTSTLSKALVDNIYGYGAKTASLKLLFERGTNMTTELLEKIKDIVGRKEIYKNITIIGRTTENFESIFNVQEIIGKINILILPLEKTQKFDDEEVYEKLVKKIEEKDEKNH